MKKLTHILIALFLLVGFTTQAYAGQPLSRPLQTGQTTQYDSQEDDGYYEKGIPHDYTVLTTGQHSGTTNIVINDNTYAHPNACVWCNRTGLMFAQGVLLGCGPADDGRLFWQQWTLENKTDIGFTTLLGAEIVTGDDSTFTGGVGNWVNWYGDASIAVVGGKGRISGTGGSSSGVRLPSVFTIGKNYKVAVKVKSISGATSIKFGDEYGGWQSFTIDGTEKTYTQYFLSGGATLYAQLSAAAVFEIDDISVREVTGAEIASGASEFDTDACCVGRYIEVSGDSDNNGTYPITITAAGKLTTSDTSIVDEAAGDTVTVSTVDDLIWDYVDQANSGSGVGGYTDWRLANVRELISILDFGTSSPSIDGTAFPSVPNAYLWSSSTNHDDTTKGWCVHFKTGYGYQLYKKTTKNRAFLVRGGV